MNGEILQNFEMLKRRCDFYFSRVLNQPPNKPELVILDLTHKCNLKCVMCDIRRDKNTMENELKTEEIFKIIDEVASWGVPHLIFSGGEPFVRKDIFKLLSYAVKRGVPVGVLTNGTSLSSDMLKKFTNFLVNGDVSLTISLDGFRRETHDYIRGVNGSFDKTLRTIKNVSKLKRKKGSKEFLEIITIILNQNLEELADILNLVKKMGVSSIQFQPLLENNLVLEKRFTNSPLWVPQSRLPVLDSVIDELVEYKEKNYNFISNPTEGLKLVKKYFRNQLTNKDIKCYSLFKTMLIANDGSVTTCGMKYGSVREKTLRECWRSKEALEARKKIKKCGKPCILPCFTDAYLNNLLTIYESFLKSLEKLNINKNEKNKITRRFLAIIKKYELLLTIKKSEITNLVKHKTIQANKYDIGEIDDALNQIQTVKKRLKKYNDYNE